MKSTSVILLLVFIGFSGWSQEGKETSDFKFRLYPASTFYLERVTEVDNGGGFSIWFIDRTGSDLKMGLGSGLMYKDKIGIDFRLETLMFESQSFSNRPLLKSGCIYYQWELANKDYIYLGPAYDQFFKGNPIRKWTHGLGGVVGWKSYAFGLEVASCKFFSVEYDSSFGNATLPIWNLTFRITYDLMYHYYDIKERKKRSQS